MSKSNPAPRGMAAWRLRITCASCQQELLDAPLLDVDPATRVVNLVGGITTGVRLDCACLKADRQAELRRVEAPAAFPACKDCRDAVGGAFGGPDAPMRPAHKGETCAAADHDEIQASLAADAGDPADPINWRTRSSDPRLAGPSPDVVEGRGRA
jgi:hypothetical protein